MAMISKERFLEELERMGKKFKDYSWFIFQDNQELILFVYGVDLDGKISHMYMKDFL